MRAVDNPGVAVPRTGAMAEMSRLAAGSPGSSVAPGEGGYPARLLRLARPPQRLHHTGSLPDPARRAVAIVGSRAASGAGCGRAVALATELGRRGFIVISGGAFGID